jgi:hypothetical protein
MWRWGSARCARWSCAASSGRRSRGRAPRASCDRSTRYGTRAGTTSARARCRLRCRRDARQRQVADVVRPASFQTQQQELGGPARARRWDARCDRCGSSRVATACVVNSCGEDKLGQPACACKAAASWLKCTAQPDRVPSQLLHQGAKQPHMSVQRGQSRSGCTIMEGWPRATTSTRDSCA